jgi:glycerol-3-phosphate dehydrogenase (NAD(P)+)
MMQSIGIVGAGAWGTALGQVATRAGRVATIWAYEADVADAINRRHENPTYLPGVALDPHVRATTDLAEAARADAVLLAVPAQFLRDVASRIRTDAPILICAKGIEQGTGATMTEVCAAAIPGARVAVLSGPTFAAEVARDLPTAVTLAATDARLGRELVQALGARTFRPYLSDDPVGAEICGAVKNVLAIACGIVEGRSLGENARAALITRGLAEMTRLAVAKGAKAETMMGLAGLGDLTLTCTGARSRNHALGVALGRGEPLASVLAGRRDVVEGVATAPAVLALAQRLGVEMPISAAVDAILHRGATIADAVEALLSRPFRAEVSEERA